MLLFAFLYPAAVAAQDLPQSICLEVDSADYFATTTINAPGSGNTITHRPTLLTWRWCNRSTNPPTAVDIPSNVAGFRIQHRSSSGQGLNPLDKGSVSAYCASNVCTCELRARSQYPLTADTPAPTGNVCGTSLWNTHPREGHSWHYWIWAYNSEGNDIAQGLISGVQHTLPVNKAPRFLEASPATRTVAQAAQAGENVGAPLSATDPEGSALTYSIGGDDGGSFAVDSGTGQLTVGQGTTFDHSTKSSYSVQVTANDGTMDATTNTASIDVIIRITPNLPPTVSASCAPCKVAPGGVARLTATARDPDGDTLTYAWSAPEGRFDGSATGATARWTAPDAPGRVTIRVQVSDGQGGSASAAVTIAVNAAPRFKEGSSTTRRVAENSPPGSNVGAPVTATDPDGDTLTYSLAGADADRFAIDRRNGQITVGSGTTLDYETRSRYRVTVHASDGSESASISVAIVVIDLLEFDEGGSTTRRVAESSPPGSSVGAPVTASGPNGPPTYSLGGADADRFAIDPQSGQITVGDGTVLDYETRSRYRVTVHASDGSESASISVTIVVIDLLDFDEGDSTTRRVAENSPPGSSVGAPVTATDPDGDPLTYSLAGADADRFAIDPQSGQITVGDGTVLDYETRSRYLVTADVTDGTESASILVTIAVIDLLDFDEGDSTTRRVAENSPPGSSVGAPVTATDPDGDPLTYSLAGADADRFAIDPQSGQITVGDGTVLDYETRSRYLVTAGVTDGVETHSIDVVIDVTDIGPPPAPGPPVVVPVSGSAGSLAVSWTAPRDAHPAITDYDVRYRRSGRTHWTAHPHSGGSARTVIPHLAAQATYAVQVRSINLEGAGAWSVAGTGSVYALANEALLTTILAALGRQMLEGVPAAVGRRFEQNPVAAGRLTLAGHAVEPSAPRHAAASCAAVEATWPSGPPRADCEAAAGSAWSRGHGASLGELLDGSGFEMPLGAPAEAGTRSTAPRWTLWGRGDVAAFQDEAGAGGRFAGNLTTGYLGFDVRTGRSLLGAAVSHGWSETDYRTAERDGGVTGKLATVLTALHPYWHWTPEAGAEAWLMVGLGTGEAVLSVTGARDPGPSRLTHSLAVANLRKTMPEWYGGQLAFRADSGVVRMTVEDGAGPLAGVDAVVWRARLGLEAARKWKLADDMSLAVFGESLGRVDRGDGVNGAGLEVAGGVRYTGRGVAIEARGRTLALHTAKGYRESGVSVTARVAPGAGGRGLALALGTRRGASTGGAEALWQDALPLGERAADDTREWALDAQIGYGLAVPGSAGVFTPFGAASVTGDRRRWKLGTRFTTVPGLTLELAGERSDGVGGPKHEVGLDLRLAF